MNELSIIPCLIDCTRLESFLCGASAAWPDFIDSDHSIEFSSTTFLSALRITPPFQLQLVDVWKTYILLRMSSSADGIDPAILAILVNENRLDIIGRLASLTLLLFDIS